MDVLIAAIPRSGSTMLASVMTNLKEKRVVFHELALDYPKKGVERQCALLDVPIRKYTEKSRLIEDIIGEGWTWGTKDVRKRCFDMAMEMHPPKKIVVLVRDIRAALQSNWVRLDQLRRTQSWDARVGSVLTTCRKQIELAQLPNARVVRYEDFVCSTMEQAYLSDWLDWPFDGSPSRGMMVGEVHLSKKHTRQHEVLMHGESITSKSLSREYGPEAKSRMQRELPRFDEYLERFQYRKS